MRKPTLTLTLVFLFAAVPMFAARKPAAKSAPEPVCNVMTEAELRIAMQPCPTDSDAATCAMHLLWARAVYATNDNAAHGNCEARKLLDDDLFAPMMAGAMMAGGPHLTDEAAKVYARYMPLFRSHVFELLKAGAIGRYDAVDLDSMAAKLVR